MKSLSVFLFSIWMMVQSVFSWDGDRAIAVAARGMLTLAAKANLAKILGNDDLASASVWLDEIERIEITMPDLYDQNQTARAETQLVKAAAHLGQVINSVRFK